MELELRQEYISCWETVCDTTLNLEETTEMIVPDACPDIMQVLDGEGRVLVQRKDAQSGHAELGGLIKVNILYQPEGDDRICSLDAMLPFTASMDDPGITQRTQLHVTPQVQNVDVHLLNPRKILVRVNFTLHVQCSSANSLALCPGVENAQEYALEQKIEDYTSDMVTSALEKTFHYSDILNLPAGRPDIKKLLRVRATCSSNEARIVGSKLVLKGEAALECLYTGQDGELYHANFDLPFSQIIECGDAGEDARAEVELIYTDMSCKPADEEGKSLAVDLELSAQCILRKSEKREMLTDLYSTQYDAQTQSKSYPVSRVVDQGAAPESVREILEVPADAVLDVQVRPNQLTRNRDGDTLELGAEVEVFALYTNQEGELDSTHRKYIVPHQIPVSDSWDYQCQFVVSRDGVASPVAEGIEISFTLEFTWTATEKGEAVGIDKVTIEEPDTNAVQQRPSVILRAVRPGESLWQIAKSFHTTVEEISEANALQSTEIYPGQLLLLPKRQERAS